MSATNTRSVSSSNTVSACLSPRTRHNRRSQNALERSSIRAALATARSPCRESDDDCVICLCKKSNRCVVLPCMHTFCFDCIYRWLCINPSCPLCKCLVERIIYSIISDTEYTEILVSDLHRDDGFITVNSLPAEMEIDEEYLDPPAGDDTVPQPHHRYNYQQLGTHLLNYLNNITRLSADGTLLVPPLVLPGSSNVDSSSSTSQTRNSTVP
ncbi:unnamed protein product [Trichobilharzia regenti]|nr:unnamed protein product [Trichobilharzia regenti]